MSQDLKEIIKAEYALCASNPEHFIRKYCHIQHPTRGRMVFNLYPFQSKVLNLWKHHPNDIILKSRQLGISTLEAGFDLWLMLFNTDKNVLCIATKQDTAKNMVTKVKFMYNNLPSWLKERNSDGSYKKPLEESKLTLKLNNGSQIKATSAASDSGRSEAVSHLVIDEGAFIEGMEELWASVQQTLATGGTCHVLSTPNGTGNWFHRMWERAENSENDFLPIKLKWDVHPERDQAWRDSQDAELGDPRLAAQECFSGDVIIYTNKGPKYIKDIKINDLVLSHDGTYNKVIRKINSISKNAVNIKSGINNIPKYTTENHPFLNKNGEWEKINSIIQNNSMIEIFPKLKYNNLSKTVDLSKYIVSNNPKYFPLKYNENYIWLTKTNIVNRNIEFDYDLGFLIGCFLSEGSLANNKVEFSFNGKTERNGFPLKIEEILSKKFNNNTFCYYTSKKWEGSSKLYIKDQIFHNFIKLCIQGGDLCYQKSLSEFFYENANLDTFKGVLDGILVGDGMLKSEYNISLLLTSEKLIYDVLYISNILGIHNVTIKTGIAHNPNNSNWRPNYTLTWLKTKVESNSKIFSERTKNILFNQQSKSKFIYDDKPYTKFKLKKHEGEIEVFNLEIENTHTYVTEYGIAHNCDCDFNTSGDTVFFSDLLDFYTQTHVQEPIEKRGIEQNYWLWEYPNLSKSYLVVADVARGDGKDNSAFHVIDLETNTQVAEYKGQLGTTEYAHFLVAVATEWNNALLVIENASIGWNTVQKVVELNYRNLYYSSKSGNSESYSYIGGYQDPAKFTPGFSMTQNVRPLAIGKLRESMNERLFIIRSKRMIAEAKVLIWKNGRAEAQPGYNDDLIMAAAMGMYIRDTALKINQQNLELTKAALGNFSSGHFGGGFNSSNQNNNPYTMNINGKQESYTWIFNK